VLPLVLVVFTAVDIMTSDGSVAAAVGSGIWSTFEVGVHIAFWTTIVFVLAERSGRDVATGGPADEAPWDPAQLPPVPAVRQIRLPDLAFGVLTAGFVLAWLPWQHFRSHYRDAAGDPVPLLDPDLWSFWLPALVVLMVAEIALEVRKYLVGHWSTEVTVANLVLNGLLAAYVVALVAMTDPVNPAFTRAMAADGVDWNPADAVPWVLVGVLVVCVWDSVECIRGHRSHADVLSGRSTCAGAAASAR
jgi:hypothetical protein